MARYGFHPDALLEYADAANYYLLHASARIAQAYLDTIEAGVRDIVAAPARWRVVEEPGIRRYVFHRFPYALYYRWEAEQQHLTIYAVMHSSREPGYWKQRLA